MNEFEALDRCGFGLVLDHTQSRSGWETANSIRSSSDPLLLLSVPLDEKAPVAREVKDLDSIVAFRWRPAATNKNSGIVEDSDECIPAPPGLMGVAVLLCPAFTYRDDVPEAQQRVQLLTGPAMPELGRLEVAVHKFLIPPGVAR
jgi:hypothetical protein